MPAVRLTPADLKRLTGGAAKPKCRPRLVALVAPSLSIEAVLPLVTRSEINLRDWRARSRRTQQAKAAWKVVTRYVEAWSMLPASVTLVRLGGRALDDDNLRSALKGVRDHVAHDLGIDDADARVRWLYGQEVGKEYGVRVTVRKEF